MVALLLLSKLPLQYLYIIEDLPTPAAPSTTHLTLFCLSTINKQQFKTINGVTNDKMLIYYKYIQPYKSY